MSGRWNVEERVGEAVSLHAEWPTVLRAPGERMVARCRVVAPAVVLGSTQPLDVVDARRAASAGVGLARRRSGGGAVLVTPEDPVWIDVWVPAGDPLWSADVSRAFDWLGDAWVEALDACGITGVSAHRGGLVACTRWSSLVCFGGVGTGEVVTDDGRKVVGLAQRRTRLGAWFHSACVLRWDPEPLVELLALADAERWAAASDLADTVVGVRDLLDAADGPMADASTIVAALVDALP